MDEPNSNANTGNDNPNVPAGMPAGGVVSHSEGQPLEGSTHKPEVQYKKRSPRERWHEFWAANTDRHVELLLAAAIAAFACIQLAITILNNRSTSQQTSQLLVAADRVDDAAESFSRSASGINGGVSDAVNNLNLQAGALDKSVAQATRLAAATEVANAHALDFDRPWIGVSLTPQDFPNGKPPTIAMEVINSGRRPAKITLTVAGADAMDKFPTGQPPYNISDPRIVKSPSTTLLVPNLHSETVLNVSTTAVDKDHLSAYDSGTLTFFAYADIEYEDVVTHKKHWTHACIRYLPASMETKAGFYQCSEYNDVDQEK